MPRLSGSLATMDDGYVLPLRRWGDEQGSSALLLAVHGFNDYGNAFDGLGRRLSQRGFLTYAYDQRGFGATTQRGRWAGATRLVRDMEQVAGLLIRRYPRRPLYLLGESMGGAVLMVAAARGLRAQGLVLVAPAVWSRDSMNPLLRLALWAGAHTVPALKVTGDGVGILPSDNLEMLRAYSTDPLVIKDTRVDALWGVTNLMDRAKAAGAGRIVDPVLLLYGEKDDIIPRRSYCALLRDLPTGTRGVRLVLYSEGWHMLTRDRQAERVLSDIAAWLQDPLGRLPSGEETRPDSGRVQRLCAIAPARDRVR